MREREGGEAVRLPGVVALGDFFVLGAPMAGAWSAGRDAVTCGEGRWRLRGDPNREEPCPGP